MPEESRREYNAVLQKERRAQRRSPKVLALQRRKQALIAATVATTDAAIVEKLTTDDLAELLS